MGHVCTYVEGASDFNPEANPATFEFTATYIACSRLERFYIREK
jgi:hypothetical protein